MKYEKYLKQIAGNAVQQLYWAWFFAREAQDPDPQENVIKQMYHIEHCMWKAAYAGQNHEWLKQALAVPRSFVEKSKRTTALAVLNEWNKQKENGR